MKGFKQITKFHDNILDDIEIALLNVEIHIDNQVDKFYSDPNYKSYTAARNDKGYQKWKEEVIKRFQNQCCVCYSTESLVAHHLYSYKYYQELRTELNNGVCICIACHELFNEENSNVNTLKQFIEFRNNYLGLTPEEIRNRFAIKRKLLWELGKQVKPKEVKVIVPKIELPIEAQQQRDKIIGTFEELQKTLSDEAQFLEAKYGNAKDIRIKFRDKETTSLSAISKLRRELMRLNTLIRCNKMKDKTIMASKFHMSHEAFCLKLQNPEEFRNFSPSEITHLNMILSQEYYAEDKEERGEV